MDARKVLVAIDPVDKSLGINALGEVCVLHYISGVAVIHSVAVSDENGWLKYVIV